MPTFIALLRGINVGGHRKVAMAQLRTLCEEAGLGDVRTYVNSGNVVFTADGNAAAHEKRIEAAVEAHYGFSVDVIVRSGKDWSAYVRGNPFPEESDKHPNFVMLMVPKAKLGTEAIAKLRATATAEKRVEPVGGVVWLCFAHGAGRSKLGAVKPGSIPVTTRNWRTVLKLDEMAKATG